MTNIFPDGWNHQPDITWRAQSSIEEKPWGMAQKEPRKSVPAKNIEI